MARQTRDQRRARRAGAAADGTSAERPRSAQPQPQQLRAAPAAKAEPVERRMPGSRGRRFVAESWAELKKVEWPDQKAVISGTVVVLVACVIVGTYLWLSDLAFKRLVQNVFLGQ